MLRIAGSVAKCYLNVTEWYKVRGVLQGGAVKMLRDVLDKRRFFWESLSIGNISEDKRNTGNVSKCYAGEGKSGFFIVSADKTDNMRIEIF